VSKLVQRWRRRNPGAPLWQLLWWEVICQPLSWLAMFLLYRIRWWGVNNVPGSGPVLLLCNHQSYLDLVTLGIGLHHRHFHSMARATLFRHPAFAWHIRSLNAFPVEQGKGDVKAVRAAIERLKQGHLVLVFPEGSRTADGRLQPFSPGVMLLIKRAKPTVVPMAVDGVFDVWPIKQARPKLRGRVGAMYGRPIPADQLLAMPTDQAMRTLEQRIESLRLDVRAKLRRASNDRYPADTLADIATV
jgi:1-acyl-sn-glycerol-3-phosphate acyltransferase